MVVGTGGGEQWGGGGNLPTKKIKSFKITTYKSVYSNKLKGAFTKQSRDPCGM